MLENPTDSSSTANISTIKRYAPPNQRNRSLSRRKSRGDRFERINNMYMNDGEKNQVAASKNIPVTDYGDAVGSNLANENLHPQLIALHGCCWAAVINAFNDTSVDLAERPFMYSASGASAWGHFRLPHQLMTSTVSAGPSSGLQMDFLSQLRRAIHDAAKASSDT